MEKIPEKFVITLGKNPEIKVVPLYVWTSTNFWKDAKAPIEPPVFRFNKTRVYNVISE